MRKFLSASVMLALAVPLGAMADTPSDVQALRREFDAVRADYEARLRDVIRAAPAAMQRSAEVDGGRAALVGR